MREVLRSLRRRFQECQRTDGSLESLRALQLDILQVVKRLQRQTAEREYVSPSGHSAQARATLWSMLGESFWLERDLTRLTRMIEGVIAEIENRGSALDSDR